MMVAQGWGRENWISNHTLNEEGATVRQRWSEQSVERCCVCCVLPFAWYFGADEKHNLHKISIRLNQPMRDGACRFVPVCFWAATRKTLPLRRVRACETLNETFHEKFHWRFFVLERKVFWQIFKAAQRKLIAWSEFRVFFFPFRVWTNNAI